MHNNLYIKNTIDKIKAKQNTLNSIMSMISYYAQETDKKFDDILIKHNIDKADLSYAQSSCMCTNNPQIVIDEFEQVINSIYKSLVLKTHPDKNNCNKDNCNKVREIFLR